MEGDVGFEQQALAANEGPVIEGDALMQGLATDDNLCKQLVLAFNKRSSVDAKPIKKAPLLSLNTGVSKLSWKVTPSVSSWPWQ